MWKKILPIALVLVVLLSLTTCGEGLPPAQEIIDGVSRARDEVSSYEFEMDMTLEMSGESEAADFIMTEAFSGALDLNKREMRIDVKTDKTEEKTEVSVEPGPCD